MTFEQTIKKLNNSWPRQIMEFYDTHFRKIEKIKDDFFKERYKN